MKNPNAQPGQQGNGPQATNEIGKLPNPKRALAPKDRGRQMAELTNRLAQIALEAGEVFGVHDHIEVELGGLRVLAFRCRPDADFSLKPQGMPSLRDRAA